MKRNQQLEDGFVWNDTVLVSYQGSTVQAILRGLTPNAIELLIDGKAIASGFLEFQRIAGGIRRTVFIPTTGDLDGLYWEIEINREVID